ncbi:hypothetical protein NMY22_g5443 [Coprinellus aureogranulatus]|nr:hypothetical protein NMY22_g5443 [Coprinellus aureogranulatus]
MVEKGELPWEAELREERERERKEREQERLAAIAAERAKAAAEDAKRQAALEAALAKQREREKAREKAEKEEEEFVTNKLRHTFLIPLAQAQSEHQQSHRKEGSTSTIDANAHRKTMFDKSSTKSPRARASDIPHTEVPEVPLLPSKSPSITSSKSRFSSFRRLGSMKSMISGRPSMDVASMSEDTRSIDSGSYVSVDEFGNSPHGHGKESSWPMLSPNGKNTVGRAASFAGKVFSRSKKSSAQANDMERAHQSMYTLPPLPDFIPQPSEPVEAPKGPRKSTSLKSLRGLMKKHVPPPMDIPPLPQAQAPTETVNNPTVVSPSSAGSPSSILSSPGPLKSPDYIGFGTMYPPSDPNARPMSVMSASSLTSVLPSPIFEGDIFSAFPPVPEHTTRAPQPGNNLGTYGMTPAPSAAAATPSFDSTLLSSALHLKSKAPKAPATPQPR